MSQDELARALREAGWKSCDRRTVQRYESGEVRRPQYQARRALLAVFGCTWEELGFEPSTSSAPSPVARETNSARGYLGSPEMDLDLEGADEVRRRTFAVGMALAGLSASNAMPAQDSGVSEALRHGLVANAAGAAAESEEWEAIRDEYAVLMLNTPPGILLQSLLGDLQQLNIALAGRNPLSVAGLNRSGAVLTSMTAWTQGNLGAVREAGRWWRTAHHLAAASGDRHIQLWVTAQEAVMALYQGTASTQLILDKIGRAEPLAEDLPHTAGTAWLYCAKAQAFGIAGQAALAERALRQLRDTFAGLPGSATADRESFLGWAETRLHFTDSFTYSHLGDYAAASAAQDRALGAFPAAVVRDPVKIELQRALCLARAGAVIEAEQHAVAQLARLDLGHHDLPIANLAARVARALPAARESDEAAHLKAYVSSSRQLSITATA